MLSTTRAKFEAREVFEESCAGISDADRKRRLQPNAPKIESAARDYEVAGAAGTIHTITAAAYEPYGEATADDLVWLYDQRLVRSIAGRKYYAAMLYSNRSGRCALCNVRTSATLDHHLPKAEHPIFAVTPDNLLPACRDCNATKLASLTATLNTNFDDLGPGPWLGANVIQGAPASVEFYLIAQPSWSPALASRAAAHFDLLRLASLYSFQASRQVAGIRRLLAQLNATVGAQGVREHLLETAISWAIAEPNSWEAALYSALAESSWFCNGGFAAE